MPSLIPANLGVVTIRYVEAQDHDSYVSLEKDADVKRYVDGRSGRHEHELLEELRKYQPTSTLMSIIDNAASRFVGRCGLLPINATESELFCLLFKTHWGKGIGSVVVPFLANLASHAGRTAVAVVHPDNGRSLALLNSLGWVASGTVSQPGKQFGHLRYVAGA